MEKAAGESPDLEKDDISPSLKDGLIKRGRFVKSPEERKLVKKINWVFMPLVVLILFVQVDKFVIRNHE